MMTVAKRRRLGIAAKGIAYAAGRLAARTVRKRTYSRAFAPPPYQAQDSAPLTGQYDYKVDYRKRKLTKGKRRFFKRKRKWRARIVNTVRNADVGSTHVVRRSLAALTTATQLSDSCCFGMYGLNGTSSDGLNGTADMREIFREISESDWAATQTVGATQHHRIYSMHATMECTIRNEGTNDALIEAYHIRGTRTAQSGTNPVQIYSLAFQKANLAQDPNTGNSFDQKLEYTQVGITPFQAPLFCRYYRIYKRTKFRIPPGNEVNFVVHDRRPRNIRQEFAFQRSTDHNYSGILFQQQGSPSASGAPTFALATNVVYSVVRRYRLKMFRDNLPKTALDVSGS